MTHADKVRAVAKGGLLSASISHRFQLTERQEVAALKREKRLRDRDKNDYRACVGCLSGIVKWNAGTDYCAACIRRKR